MRKARRVFLATTAGIACLVASAAPALAAPASYSWALIGCANTKISGAKICFYYNSKNNQDAQGRFVNNSTQNIKNQGFFIQTSGSNPIGYECGDVTTKAGTTATCTRSLNNATWVLTDTYTYKGSNAHVQTAAHDFR